MVFVKIFGHDVSHIRTLQMSAGEARREATL